MLDLSSLSVLREIIKSWRWLKHFFEVVDEVTDENVESTMTERNTIGSTTKRNTTKKIKKKTSVAEKSKTGLIYF